MVCVVVYVLYMYMHDRSFPPWMPCGNGVKLSIARLWRFVHPFLRGTARLLPLFYSGRLYVAPGTAFSQGAHLLKVAMHGQGNVTYSLKIPKIQRFPCLWFVEIPA